MRGLVRAGDIEIQNIDVFKVQAGGKIFRKNAGKGQ